MFLTRSTLGTALCKGDNDMARFVVVFPVYSVPRQPQCTLFQAIDLAGKTKKNLPYHHFVQRCSTSGQMYINNSNNRLYFLSWVLFIDRSFISKTRIKSFELILPGVFIAVGEALVSEFLPIFLVLIHVSFYYSCFQKGFPFILSFLYQVLCIVIFNGSSLNSF